MPIRKVNTVVANPVPHNEIQQKEETAIEKFMKEEGFQALKETLMSDDEIGLKEAVAFVVATRVKYDQLVDKTPLKLEMEMRLEAHYKVFVLFERMLRKDDSGRILLMKEWDAERASQIKTLMAQNIQILTLQRALSQPHAATILGEERALNLILARRVEWKAFRDIAIQWKFDDEAIDNFAKVLTINMIATALLI